MKDSKITVRDAVHENIELNSLEAQVLDSKPMQRLRYVRQLSLTYLVYPSALHTRFEHSLGTFHLTSQLVGENFGGEQAQLLRLYALLHDVGHPAFSHLSEPILEKRFKKSHEQMGADIIRRSEISDILSKHGYSSKELLSLASKPAGKVVSGGFGTDRIDYLLRDAYFTGVAYSLIDAQRLLRSLLFKGNELVLSEKGFLAAESLMVSRYLMFSAVYNQKAVRIASAMLLKALDKAVDAREISAEDVAQGTDDALLSSLSRDSLISMILHRRLFKSVFRFKESPADLERTLSSKFNASEFVVCPPVSKAERFDIKVAPSGGKPYSFYAKSKLAPAIADSAEKDVIVASGANIARELELECRKLA